MWINAGCVSMTINVIMLDQLFVYTSRLNFLQTWNREHSASIWNSLAEDAAIVLTINQFSRGSFDLAMYLDPWCHGKRLEKENKHMDIYIYTHILTLFISFGNELQPVVPSLKFAHIHSAWVSVAMPRPSRTDDRKAWIKDYDPREDTARGWSWWAWNHQWGIPNSCWLVVTCGNWLPWIWHFPIHIGLLSSSQFTNSYFSEGWPNHQPGWLLFITFEKNPNLYHRWRNVFFSHFRKPQQITIFHR